MKNPIILMTVFCLFSCSSGTLKEDYEALKSKEIVLPEYKHVTVNGKDTLFPDLLDTELKLVVFCDSTRCNSCAIESLYGWEDIIHETEQFKDLSYYFIFTCKNGERHKVDSIIHETDIDYPIILDSLGEFSRVNSHLPKDDLFHTFLLKRDKVVMVGNPRRNRKTMNLFKETVRKYSVNHKADK